MMGPGRWGSSSIELGVNVSYADINNTAVLVEMDLLQQQEQTDWAQEVVVLVLPLLEQLAVLV
jgi:hypothetical protein